MKKITLIAAMAAVATAAQAGGLLTNTNQNAAFLRNFAQEGQITLTSLYANPAGNAFLSKGWHMSLNSQTAKQFRTIQTTFPLFAMNAADPGQTTHEYKGEALAPVIPSITVSHNWDKWSLSAHFGLIGGGGKCEFDQGLGSFEALFASNIAQQIPAIQDGVNAALPLKVQQGLMANGLDATTAATLAGMGTYSSSVVGYSLDGYMRGRSYYFGLQIGGAYKIQENLAAFLGVRGVYGTCNYNGYVQDVKAIANYSYSVPAAGAFPGVPTTTGTEAVNLNSDLALNCDQTGFGLTPIIGLDWEINKHWNVAAKYEAPTRMNLKNKSEMNAVAQAQAANPSSPLAQFKDGEKVREDIPAILALGAEYRLNDKVRFDGSFKTYFDKGARKYGQKEDLIDHNTFDICLGAEYDVHKLVTISASWQNTRFGLSDEYMNDLSFNLPSHSIGLGVRLHPSKLFNIDLGYMYSIYQDHTVNTTTAAGIKTDVYSRKNNVVGIGFNFAI